MRGQPMRFISHHGLAPRYLEKVIMTNWGLVKSQIEGGNTAGSVSKILGFSKNAFRSQMSKRFGSEWWKSQACLSGKRKTKFKPRHGVIKTCPVCGKRFYVETSLAAIAVNCSRRCMGKAREKPKVSVSCNQCGKKFEVHPSFYYWHNKRGHKNFYCSTTCRNTYHRGANAPAWIADRSLLKNPRARPNGSREHKEWRQAVYERDGYTCAICNMRGGVLEPHHIKKWSRYPKLRYDINNGITLHKKCHYLTRYKEHLWKSIFTKMIRRKNEIKSEQALFTLTG